MSDQFLRPEGDTYTAGDAAATGQASDYDGYSGYSASAPNPYGDIGAINPSTLAPMFGAPAGSMGGMQASEPEYLHYEPKSWVERMFYNSGSAYLLGIGSGGVYGVLNGLQTSPSPKFKIRINTILNKSGRYGSRFGNALGAVAMMYSCFEASADKMHIEDYVPAGDGIANPVLAAAMTGLLYKSTQGPKTMALAGLIGASAVAGIAGARVAMTRGSGRAGALFF